MSLNCIFLSFSKKILLTLIVILLLGGCNLTKEQDNKTANLESELATLKNQIKTSYFEKKEKCSNYRNEIQNLIEEDSSLWSSNPNVESYANTLDKIFYSPSLDTCLYSYIAQTKFKTEEIDNAGYILDYFTGKYIFSTNTLGTDRKFPQMKDELDKEVTKLETSSLNGLYH